MSVDTTHEASTTPEPTVASSHYRYPGSPPFQDSELDRRLFKGRREETDQVLHAILSSDLFLLFAVSGLGKTSLLNAGVMHELRARGHWPVSIRLNDPTKRPVVEIREQIEDAARADPSIDLVRDPSVAGDVDPDSSLWDLFASLEVWKGTQLQQLVVILDQFEELFTLGWDRDERARFITDFGEVVRRHRLRGNRAGDAGANGSGLPPPTVKFVIVVREDSLGELEALATDVPQILRNRFRLGPLDRHQAEVAIREPALVEDDRLDSQRFTYTEAASQEILDFLGTNTERGAVVHTDAIDPSQLQIVCQYVERAILPRKDAATPTAPVEIDAPDLGGRVGLDRILGDFYRRTLESFPAGEQDAVRRLCERGLINPNGRRLSLEQGEIATTFKVSPSMLQQLVDERLLRADARVGSVYYELAHDTLVSPILTFSEEQRARRNQRRVRWAAIAAGCVIVVVGAALISWLALRSPDDPDAAQPVLLGQPIGSSIDEPGDSVVFTVTADREQTLRVTVTPTTDGDADEGDVTELDVAVELTNAQAVKREPRNQLGRGQAEFVIVPPVAAGALDHQLSVEAFDASIGSFDVAVEEQETTQLGPGDSASGEISQPGDLAVYRVVTDGSEPIAIDVVPREIESEAVPGAEEERKDPDLLDAEVELIDPSGVGTPIDFKQDGERESVLISDAAGEYVLVVRGYQASTGPFDVVVAEPGVQFGEITSPDDEAEFSFDHAGDGLFGVTVTPDESFDVEVQIVDPGGTEQLVDSGGDGRAEFTVHGQREGEYVVTVRGFDGGTGRFSIEAGVVTPHPLAPGDSTTVDGPAVFEVTTGEDDVLTFSASPDSGEAYVSSMRTVDAEGNPIEERYADDPADGIALIVTGASTVIVDASGEYTASVEPTPVQELATGASTTASDSAVFEVSATDDELLTFSARPDSGNTFIESLRTVDSEGTVIYERYADDPADGIALIVTGASTVIVQASGDYTASLQPADVEPLVPGDSTTASDSAVFEVTVGDGDAFVVAARPDSEADYVANAVVIDPNGTALGDVVFDESGAVTIEITDASAGTHRVFVDGYGDYTVSLTEN